MNTSNYPQTTPLLRWDRHYDCRPVSFFEYGIQDRAEKTTAHICIPLKEEKIQSFRSHGQSLPAYYTTDIREALRTQERTVRLGRSTFSRAQVEHLQTIMETVRADEVRVAEESGGGLYAYILSSRVRILNHE